MSETKYSKIIKGAFGILSIIPLISFVALAILATKIGLINLVQGSDFSSVDIQTFQATVQAHPLGTVYIFFACLFFGTLIFNLIILIADLFSNKQVRPLAKLIWFFSIIILPISFPVYWLMTLRHSKVWN